MAAVAINHLLPLSPSSRHDLCSRGPSPSPWIPSKSAASTSSSIARGAAVAVKVSFNPSGNYDLSIYDGEDDSSRFPPPMPPTDGRFDVVIDNDTIHRLDLSPFNLATEIASPWSSVEPEKFLERTIGFTINYNREDPHDLRELSEIPEVRLWFVRLDATYPWLPVLLDWRAGELARYAAMLVPHQMSMRMGIVFNPEALELFIMNKVFTVYSWLKQNNVPRPRIKTADMAKMLGFAIGDELFDLIDQQSIPT